MSFPRYPKYKPSGVEAIGEVPEHWEVRPLRQIGRMLKGTGGSKEDVVEAGVPCVRYGDLYTTHSFFIESARTFLTAEKANDYTLRAQARRCLHGNESGSHASRDPARD